MRDPAGAFEQVRQNFLLYVKTAFGTRSPSLEAERARLLLDSDTFCREPWIEPLPQHETRRPAAALTAEDVPGLSAGALDDFRSLAACGLVGDFDLFVHQLTMLRRSSSGENVVVTAGTGSGKTEAFLLPIFAYLAGESTSWPAPGQIPPHHSDWWLNEEWQANCATDGRSCRVRQRGHEARPAAVRALILYPMNALVEDQMTRLRRALDGQEARGWYHSRRPGNRIYFGRYNSNTPVPGHEFHADGTPNRAKILEQLRELQRIGAASRAADLHAAETGVAETRFFFPRLDGSEMRTRWDMQDAPPDILITNFSMLSVMMMREADRAIFDRTREWLQADGSVFHLVLDELHLYRGTAGTETAYLVRLLLNRLGLSPDSPKLRILASSASLEPTDPQSVRFLSEFFGTQWTAQQIVPGALRPSQPLVTTDALPVTPFAALAGALDTGDQAAVASACARLAEALGGAPGAGDGVAALRHAMDSDAAGLAPRLLHACEHNGETRAVPLSQFGDGLFGNAAPKSVITAATRGILAARGMCHGSRLPTFRLHWFFRNIEGLWACTDPSCRPAHHGPDPARTVGQLFGNARILCANQATQHRVLEVLYCEQCGTVLLGGSRLTLADAAGWEMVNTDPDIEGIPDRQVARFLDRRSMREYAVFWPMGAETLHPDVPNTWQQAAATGDGAAQARWVRASLSTASARVVLGAETPSIPDGPWVPGFVFHLPRVQDATQQERYSALPSICPACAADYRRRLMRRSPIRGFRTGFSKVSQLLSKELFYMLPVGETRKLVVFSDSREDAAAISNGIERLHYSDLVREALYDELYLAAFGEGTLVEDIDSAGVAVRALAQEYASKHPGATGTIQADLATIAAAVPETLPEALREIVASARTAAATRLAGARDRLAHRIVPVGMLFESPTDPTGTRGGALITRLKRLGVNPAGQDVLYQDYFYDGAYHHWTEFFDFDSDEHCWRSGLSPAASERIQNKLLAKVRSEICGVLFSRLYFGFEAAGLGHACLGLSDPEVTQAAAPCGASTDLFRQLCNGCLRIMGEMYRYPQEPADYPLEDWPDWSKARARRV